MTKDQYLPGMIIDVGFPAYTYLVKVNKQTFKFCYVFEDGPIFPSSMEIDFFIDSVDELVTNIFCY